jgi:cell division ATPase FtsA
MMFAFPKSGRRTTIAVDIGSSSAGVAIVSSDSDNNKEIIWNHREYVLIHDDVSEKKQQASIKTAIVNAFLELSHSGLKALKTSGHDESISEVQTLYSAPWSYTLSKTITLKDEHPFEITEDTIKELLTAAKKQSKLTFATSKMTEVLGLTITHGDVIDIKINDYSITDPVGQEGRKVSLTYLETAISETVKEAVTDTVQKLFPKTPSTNYSFMYAFYLTMKNLQPNTSETCLIDVTGEATEIGIVREDILKHTSFSPAGTYSISRALATNTGITKEEAYSYMKDSPDEIAERVPKRAYEKVSDTIKEYEQKITDLFRRTGDELTVPKTIFLHTDARTESFFIDTLSRAASAATDKKYTIHPITAKIMGETETDDTAMLLGIDFQIKKAGYFTLLPEND